MPKKFIGGLIVALILLASTLGMFNCYGLIESIGHKEAEEVNKYRSEMYLFNDSNLETTVYAFKYRLQNDGDQTPAQALLNITGDVRFIQYAKEIFEDEYFWRWNQHVDKDVNIHYYAIDHTTQRAIWNDQALENLDNQELEKQYQVYLRVSYDEHGEVSVYRKSLEEQYDFSYLFDEDQRASIERFIQRDTEYVMNGDYLSGEYSEDYSNSEITLKPIQNMTFVFAVPLVLEPTGGLYWDSSWVLQNVYGSTIFVYAFMFSVLLFIVALLFPIRIVKEWNWFAAISKLKFEIMVVGLIASITFSYMGAYYLLIATLQGELMEVINHFQLSGLYNEISALLNMGLWFLLFFQVMLVGFMIRFIFNKGLMSYLRENTCLFWTIGACVWLAKCCGNIIDRIFRFDLKDPVHRIVFKVVFVNLVIMSILCCFFVFGLVFGLVYSVILFFMLRKNLRKIQTDYLILLNAAKQLSNGNFNVTIDQDVGVFNSLRDAFTDLKIGFEKAVNEEVKSQRMKTELISNVSHDLKTPLTSIITYVDLLKKEGITEQEKEEYINTIDRNSQRLKNLIADLFEISKANSGNVSLHLVDVDIVSLIQQVKFECQEKIEAAHLDFKMNFSSDKITLLLDSLKTYRIFENLIINICKYALPYTRVYVDVNETEEEVTIVFKNISANEISVEVSEITERFVQGDKSRNTEGSGLGLAIVKSFTQLQNGDFQIDVDGDLFKAILKFRKTQSIEYKSL